MEKIEKQSKILKEFVKRPSSNKPNAMLFLKYTCNQLFQRNNNINDKNNENDSNLKEDQEEDFNKLDQFQTWNLIEEKINDSIKIYNKANDFKYISNHIKDVEKELDNSVNKLEYQIGKHNKKNKKHKQNDDYDEIEEDDEDEDADNEGDEEGEGDDGEEDSFDMGEFEKLNEELDMKDEKKKGNKKSSKHKDDEDEDLDNEDIDNDEDFEEDEDEKIDNDKEAHELLYSDVFGDEKNKKKKKNPDEEEIDDAEIEDGIFSREHGYAANNDKNNYSNKNLIDEIDQLEEDMVSKKPWQMRGEIKAKERPMGSLIEQTLDFKVSSRPKPLPSSEINALLEKIIKIRIANDLFDDPKRTIFNKNGEDEENKNNELKFEKSNKGLAELYEEAYVNDIDDGNTQNKTNDHYEVEEMMEDLFTMFNGLTNSTFVGERVKSEMNVVKNVKALKLEDINKFNISYSNKNNINNNDSTDKKFNKIVQEYNPRKNETHTKDDLSSQELKQKHKQMKRKVKKKIYERNLKNKMNLLSQEYDSKYEVRLAMKQTKDKIEKKDHKSKDLKSTKFFGALEDKKTINSVDGKNLNIKKDVKEIKEKFKAGGDNMDSKNRDSNVKKYKM
jgi:U3 small nucleolar RNA-associated protein MPP10